MSTKYNRKSPRRRVLKWPWLLAIDPDKLKPMHRWAGYPGAQGKVRPDLSLPIQCQRVG